MVKVKQDLTGMKYGRLTVLKQSEEDYVRPDGRREARWECVCDCLEHNTIIKTTTKLKTSLHPSCGCWGNEIRKQNGLNQIDRNCKHKTQNKYDLTGDYGIGFTHDGTQFLFDIEDFDLIKNYKWYIGKNGYVYGRKSKEDHVLLHRLIMNPPNNLYVDHQLHNLLDNRKFQLRIVSQSQNSMNHMPLSNNASGYNGVYFHTPSNKWCAYIKVNQKQYRKYCNTKRRSYSTT